MYWQAKKGKQVHTSIITISETNLKLSEKPERQFSWTTTVHHTVWKTFWYHRLYTQRHHSIRSTIWMLPLTTDIIMDLATNISQMIKLTVGLSVANWHKILVLSSNCIYQGNCRYWPSWSKLPDIHSNIHLRRTKYFNKKKIKEKSVSH